TFVVAVAPRAWNAYVGGTTNAIATTAVRSRHIESPEEFEWIEADVIWGDSGDRPDVACSRARDCLRGTRTRKSGTDRPGSAGTPRSTVSCKPSDPRSWLRSESCSRPRA